MQLRYKILYDEKHGLIYKKSKIYKYIITGFFTTIITLYLIFCGFNKSFSVEKSRQALNGIVSDIKGGEGIIEAVSTFCRDMIYE